MTATVFRLFVSSPGDVAAERVRLEAVVDILDDGDEGDHEKGDRTMAEVIGPCKAAHHLHHLPGRGATSTPTAPPLATAIGRPSQPASFPVWQRGAP